MEASISGIASGIQWADIIDDLMAVERRPVDRLESQIEQQQRKTDAWDAVRSLLQTLNSATQSFTSTTGTALQSFSVGLSGFPSATGSPVSVTAGPDASPGTHTVRVLARAESEMLGSQLQASRSDALGLSGEMLVNGRAIQVQATDSLDDVAARINAANSGSSRSGVSATVAGVDGRFRLLLSASETGEGGIRLGDPDGLLQGLGLIDGTTALRNRTPSGFTGDSLSDAGTAVAELRGLTGGSGVGTIQLGSGPSQFSVALDLTTMSLDDVATAIQDAAALAGSPVTASVESTADGERLVVAGTNAYVDDGGVLQILGAVEGGRSAVAQRVEGGLLATDGAGTAATAATLLTDLWTGGSAAGVTAGDTLTFAGTRGDGTTFEFEHTVAGGDTLQTILDRLNGAEGYDGSATATVSAEGRIQVADGSSGASRLGLEMFAGNEGGGSFDPGAFTVAEEGRRREVVAGSNALVEVNGTFLERESNTITDAIAGVTLDLTSVAPDTEVDVTITRDVGAAVEAVQTLVTAYNKLSEFVDLGLGVQGGARPALAGDSVLRTMRTSLQQAMQSQILQTLGGGATRLGDVGIEIQKDRSFSVDVAVLTAAFESDFDRTASLISGQGFTSSSAISFLGSTGATAAGTYDVVVTAAATTASVTSAGAAATYVDDGVADQLTITDTSTNRAYTIDLANGDSLADIVDRLNDELGTAQARELQASRSLFADAGGAAAADENTLLSDLFYGDGSSAGFAPGQVVTMSGTAANGVSFMRTFTVSDPSTQTLGDLRDSLSSGLAGTADVSIVNGAVEVTAAQPGTSLLAVTVGSDIPGNSAFLGTMDVAVQGRNASDIRAELDGSEIRITAPIPGSARGFSLQFTGGGADGTAQLGLSDGSWAGTDVVGTIGGEPATGVGDVLTGAADTAAQGLSLRTGAGTGSLGTVTFSPGVAASMEEVLSALLGTGTGSVTAIQEGLDRSVDRITDQIDRWEGRLERRREMLVRQFTALELALAQAQSQSNWLAAQFSSMGTSSAGNG
ncbi:flagellar filament capping protein FliD [Gaopeijia maritima]|uniref:flagellar filament capping protein FliD n=1 Tax=Gaopeijia maritima TaxID=3119007 RepID=UPI00327B4791